MKEPIWQGAPPIPETRAEVREIFGDPRPRLNAKGNLVATNPEFRKQIVPVEFPIWGGRIKRRVHYKLVDLIYDALTEVIFYVGCEIYPEFNIGDSQQVKTLGTYCTRYIRGSKTKRLSLHSWGIAVDINHRENRRGRPRKIKSDSLITWAFERRGFSWGGYWRGKSCDPMHYEYFWR